MAVVDSIIIISSLSESVSEPESVSESVPLLRLAVVLQHLLHAAGCACSGRSLCLSAALLLEPDGQTAVPDPATHT